MTKYRSILALLFAVVVVFFIGFSNPATAKPVKKLTYTSEQIADIQTYANELAALGNRLPELQDLIQKEDWTFVRNFIHGPLGEIRLKMGQAARKLLPDAQKQARQVAKQVGEDLVAIDQAAENQQYKIAIRCYGETIKDLETFFQLLPQA
jgi:photosystem II protein PsbQ